MQDDPVVAEIRRIREELAARFNYDIHAIFEYARQRDVADNHKVIRLPPRRPADVAVELSESTGITSDRS